MECKNCSTAFEGNFCPNCSQKVMHGRFTIKQILRDLFQMITNLEKGFWYTMKELFVRPDQVIKEYLSGVTVKYYNPFRFYFIIIAVSALLQVWLGVFDLQQATIRETFNPNMTEEELQRQLAYMENVKKFLNIIPLVVLPFIATFFYLIFRKQGWNFAEHLISATYIYAQTAIIGLFLMSSFYFFPEYISYSLPASFLISSLYFAYVYRRLFSMSFVKAFFLSLLSIIGGFLFMIIAMGVMGLIIGIAVGLISKIIG